MVLGGWTEKITALVLLLRPAGAFPELVHVQLDLLWYFFHEKRFGRFHVGILRNLFPRFASSCQTTAPGFPRLEIEVGYSIGIGSRRES